MVNHLSGKIILMLKKNCVVSQLSPQQEDIKTSLHIIYMYIFVRICCFKNREPFWGWWEDLLIHVQHQL